MPWGGSKTCKRKDKEKQKANISQKHTNLNELRKRLVFIDNLFPSRPALFSGAWFAFSLSLSSFFSSLFSALFCIRNFF